MGRRERELDQRKLRKYMATKERELEIDLLYESRYEISDVIL